MIFFYSFISTYIITYFALPFLKKIFLVEPNKRSSHLISKPTAGGIVFVLIITLVGFFKEFYVPLLCLPLSIIGLVDDKFDLKPISRIFVQVFTIVFLIYFSPLNETLVNNYSSFVYLPILFAVIFSFTACINFLNFVDGLDGLLTGCMIIIFSSICISQRLDLWAYIGSLMGFLILNWSPSKVFMGDVGSTFIGALFVGTILQTDSFVDGFKSFLLASPLLGDALISVVRRYMSGKSITIPHKSFFFQRLHQGGLSHRRVSCIYMSACLALGLTMIFGNLFTMLMVIIIELFILFYLDNKFAVKFE